MSCSNCTGIDVFPLKKCATSGSIGPTGPRGKRGPGGNGFNPNYLCVIRTVNDNGDIADQPLTNDTETFVKFGAEITNSGNWGFNQGQSTFIAPDTGTYTILFSPNVVFSMGTNSTFIVAFTSHIYVNDTEVFFSNKSKLHLTGSADGNNEFNIPLTQQAILNINSGDILKFGVRAFINLGEDITEMNIDSVATSLSIARIA